MIKIHEERQFKGHFSDRQPDRVLRMCSFLENDLYEGNLSDIEVLEVNEDKSVIKYRDTIKFEVKSVGDTNIGDLVDLLETDGHVGFAIDNLLEAKGDEIEGVIRVFSSDYRFVVRPIYQDSDFRMGNIY